MKTILDHGYVNLIETWGSDERIIEAARMSTDKGFQGWGPVMECPKCKGRSTDRGFDLDYCPECPEGPTLKEVPGDERLLGYLYRNKHATPFEMAGLVIEVKAPIFVFREWHRHRTQSFNEMSARYIPMPDEHYMPDIARVMMRGGANKQAQGSKEVSADDAAVWMDRLDDFYRVAEEMYQFGLTLGVPKELARLAVPVARYSKMRASANLRNWLGFLALRMDPAAQWEIRQYAQAVGELIAEAYPRTWALFMEGR